MNFKKMMKRGQEGFTLVELIVVIAILGILGGVAIPAYSGYVKKAERSADEALLNAVNTAFASACMINGENNYFRNDVTASNAGISNGEFVYSGPFAEAFEGFYEGGEFKVITSVVYDAAFGGFKDPTTADELTISYGGSTITVSGEVLQALQNSTFGSEMGGEALLNEITGLTNMMSASGSGLAQDLLGNADYMASFAKYLGYTGDLADQTEVQKFIMAQQEVNGGNLTNDQLSQAMVNGMVFYAAEGMKDYDVNKANTLLNSDNIYSSLSTDPATRLAEASLVYGMYAGFVNSEFNKGDAANGVGKAESSTDNPMGAIQNISGTGAHSANFQAYLDSDQGQADMKAYMEAMKVINDVSGTGAGAGVLVNGFEDSELSDLLTQVLGK